MLSKKQSFEEELKKLEKSVSNINQNMTVSELILEFKNGTKAAKKCIEFLKNAESEIKIISQEIDSMLEESVDNDRNCFERKKESD